MRPDPERSIAVVPEACLIVVIAFEFLEWEHIQSLGCFLKLVSCLAPLGPLEDVILVD